MSDTLTIQQKHEAGLRGLRHRVNLTTIALDASEDRRRG